MESKKGVYVRIVYYLFFSVVAVLLFLNRFDVFKYLDVDLLWHIRVGEDIIRNHSISIANNFSWLEGTLWTQQEWLFDVVIYLISNYLNVFGFIFVGLIVVGLTYAVPYFINDWKYKILSVIIYYYLFVIFKVNSINRPMWFSIFIIFALMQLFDSKKISRKYKPILYALIGVLASNFHAGMIVVLFVVLLLNIAFDIFFKIKFDKTVDKHSLMFFMVDCLAFVLGYMINPIGPMRIVEMFNVSSLASTSYIPEWKPLTIPGALGALLLVVVVFTLGYGFNCSFTKKDSVECRHIVVVTAISCLGIMSQKSGVVAILFFMLYAYKYLELIIDNVLLADTKIEKSVDSFYKLNKSSLRYIPLVLVVLVSFLIAYPYSMQMESFDYYVKHGYHVSYFLDRTKDNVILDSVVSEDVINYLKVEANEDDFSVLNSYIMGNYLVWERVPTFIDSRQFPYADGATEVNCTAFDDYIYSTSTNEEAFFKLLDDYKFKYVIVGNSYVVYNETMTKYISDCDNYELVMSDDNSGCYLYRRVG